MLHPIVASLRPNAEQVPAILARGRDVVVTAGAGTGKTRTLVARYLALVAEGLPVRSVVAVTFTRKAAHEMRNRAREAVRRYLASPELDDRERARWQALYGQLDAARIGTIHTLCAEILRTHPVEAARCYDARGGSTLRIDPGFDVLDEARAALLQEEAVDLALAWSAGRDEVALLFALARERALRDGLLQMLRARLAVSDCRPGWDDPCWADWEARLLRPICGFVDDRAVRDAFSELSALRDDGTLDRAAAAGDGLAGSVRTLLDLWDAVMVAREAGDWERVAAGLHPLRTAMRRNAGRDANWAPAEPKRVIAALQAAYDATVKPWAGDDGLDLGLDRRLMAAMPGLARLHTQAVAAYGALKAEWRALDFDDLEQGALDLLRGDAAVCARWQGEVRALLVDEFQDTNARQRDLLQLLNGPAGKLFVVGDAKQSIYGFRGADVTVFRRERDHAARQEGVLSLDVSYRAHRELIEGLNALLCPVLGVEADADRPWAEPFAPLRWDRVDPAPGLGAPHVELHFTVGAKADGALDRAADAVAGRLRALVEGGGARVNDGDGERPLGYGDVAILCRASSSFAPYEDALDRSGVPYVTVAGRGFYERPEVRDVLNLLRALADPDDDLALAGALRSPVIGLSDVALCRLCDARRSRGGNVALWDVLSDAGDVLLGEAPRAGAALVRLAELRGLVGRTTVADVLKALYDATGYPAVLAAVGQGRGSRNLAKLLDDAHRSGLVGVGEFLEYVTSLRDVGAREGEARALSEGAVQIMSVHAAKGLEFPVVIIGDVVRQPAARDGIVIDPEVGPLLPLRDDGGRMPLVTRLARMRLKDQEAAESGRLFYVAATRARELLILNGCVSLTRDGRLSRLGGWLAPVVEAGATDLGEITWEVDSGGTSVQRREVRIGVTPATCCLYEPCCRPAVAHAGRSVCDEESRRRESRPLADARGDDGMRAAGDAVGCLPDPAMLDPVGAPAILDEPFRDRERCVWRVVPGDIGTSAPPWVAGQIVHEALAQWCFGGEGFDAWAEGQARRHGLTDPVRIRQARTVARRLLQRLRAHRLYEEMAAARPLRHGVPYSVERDGRVEVDVIDVLYHDENGWTILDVRTERLESAAAAADWLREQRYAERMARCRDAVEELLGKRPRTRLCFLDVAGGVHVVSLGGG